MFVAIYEFKVKPGCENQFVNSWQIVTEGIYKARGSLGSRLHKAGAGHFIAYAQWPSEERFNVETPLPEDISKARVLMQEACESISLIKKLEVVSDFLQGKSL